MVRWDGLFVKKDNRSGHEGEWITTRGVPGDRGYYYTDYLGKKYYAHKEVARAYVPVPEELIGRDDLIVHHRDEDKHNNQADNLEWMTFGEHSSHHKAGEVNHNAKLTNDQAREILEAKGGDPKELAKQYGVSVPTIYNIWAGRIWTTIQKDLNAENNS